MKNPVAADMAAKRVKAEAASGGTCPEGTSQSPQKGAGEAPSFSRSKPGK